MTIELYFGLDVQIRRNCSYFILNPQLECVDSGWLSGEAHNDICKDLFAVLKRLEKSGFNEIAFGIDAPRIALAEPREFYWKSDCWRKRNAKDRGYGRHCEVILKALSIANPQWTPLANEAPPWMKLGFKLFESLKKFKFVFEVFPSASYLMLKGRKHPKVSINFANFADGPKDMLDACISALTVYEYIHGLGSEVGGGDGLGSIVLPTELPVFSSHPVLIWPGKRS
jgi:hypothetical protein